MPSEETQLDSMKADFPVGYAEYLNGLKERIQQGRARAALAVNSELIMLYWQIGRELLDRQAGLQGDTQVIDVLAKDLSSTFSDNIGFSPRNLKHMKVFAEAFPDSTFVQQVAAQIPWGHMIIILDRAMENQERCWYMEQTIQNGWSLDVLEMQIESELYRRQREATDEEDS